MKEGFKITELGEIPEHWNAIKLSTIAEIKGRIGFRGYTKADLVKKGQGALTIGAKHINKNSLLNLDDPEYISWEKYEESPEIKVLVGDILMVQRGSLGKVAIVENLTEPATINPSMVLLKKIKCSNYFLYYALSGYYIQKEIEKITTSTAVPMISQIQIKGFIIALPPLKEQQKIAEILSTVDEKIEVTEEQIRETETLKKGLMQRLLTKGIGHTKFKDSPLGQIPESWEARQLKTFAKCFVGIASSATHAYSDKGIMLIRNQNIKEGKLDLSDVLFVNEEYEIQHKSKRLKQGDILTVRTGYPGISAVVPKELEGCQSFTTLIIRQFGDMMSSEFMCYFINSNMGKSFFNSNQAGNGQQNVGSKTLENLYLPVPPKFEQVKIAEILFGVDNKLDILMDKKKGFSTIKKGLMQQLLTGKLRVK